jgi:tetratricopeptide (TPR) repeat protein
MKITLFLLTLAMLLCSSLVISAQSLHYGEAQEEFQKKEYLLAMLAAQKAVKEDDNNPAYHHLYGLILTELKQYTEARAQLRKAIAQDPQNADYHYALGAMLLREHREQPAATPLPSMLKEQARTSREKAIAESLERAVQLDPDHLNARLALGTFYHASKMSRLASQQFSVITQKDPSFPGVHYHHAAVYLNNGRLPDALRELKTEVELHPDDPSARLELGDLLLHTGSAKGALEQFLATERTESALPDLYFGMAKAYRDLGQLERAIEAARKCIELSPKLPASHALLGKLYDKKGDSKMARKEMEIFERLQGEIAAELAAAYRSQNRK